MPEHYVTNQDENGSVSISEDVIAVMVTASVAEVEGVAGLSNTVGPELQEFLGKRSVSKGIKVAFEDGVVVIDVLITVRYGYAVADVARKVQEEVYSSVDSMTNLKGKINVHVTGIAFDKSVG